MSKLVAEYLPQIRTDSLKRQGFFGDEYWRKDYERGSTDPMRMLSQDSNSFRYLLKIFGNRQSIEASWILGEQRIFVEAKLITTDVNFGKYRYWFSCPTCSNRCGVLYIYQSILGCNKCLQVAYASQNKTKRKEIPLDEVIENGKALTELWLELWKKNRFFYDNEPTHEYLKYLKAACQHWALYLADPEHGAIMYQAHDPLLFKPPHLVIPS